MYPPNIYKWVKQLLTKKDNSYIKKVIFEDESKYIKIIQTYLSCIYLALKFTGQWFFLKI